MESQQGPSVQSEGHSSRGSLNLPQPGQPSGGPDGEKCTKQTRHIHTRDTPRLEVLQVLPPRLRRPGQKQLREDCGEPFLQTGSTPH